MTTAIASSKLLRRGEGECRRALAAQADRVGQGQARARGRNPRFVPIAALRGLLAALAQVTGEQWNSAGDHEKASSWSGRASGPVATDVRAGPAMAIAVSSIELSRRSRAESGWVSAAARTADMRACRAGPRRYTSSTRRPRTSELLPSRVAATRRRARAWWRRRCRFRELCSSAGSSTASTIAGAEPLPPRGRPAS